jgi:hypothetical protein
MAGTGSDPMSPSEALTVLETQRHRVSRSLQVDVVAMLAAWGVTWLVGFGLAYLASGSRPAVSWWVAGPVIGVLYAAALAVSFGLPIRQARGITGPSRRVMSMYMWAWALAFGAVAAINDGLVHQGLPARLTPLLWSGTSALVVGLLFLGSGFLFRDLINYGLGGWMLVTGAASVFAGFPGNFAVLALAGGGGFLAAAVPYAVSRRRAQA